MTVVAEVGVGEVDPGLVFKAIAKAIVDAIKSLSDTAGQPVGAGDAFMASMDMTAVFAVAAGISADEFADEASRAWGRAVAAGERQ